MNTNDLCTREEYEAGFSAHISSNGVIILQKNSKGNYEYFMEVALEDLHDILKDYL